MVVDPTLGAARYVQLAVMLRERIAAGVYRPGAELPAEARIGHQFGVGTTTVRRALALLCGEGLIVTERGRPARIRFQPERVHLAISDTDQANARMPTPAEAHRFQLAPGVPVIEIRHADGRSVVYPADRVGLTGAAGSDTEAAP